MPHRASTRLCHPDRPHYSHGFCWECFDRLGLSRVELARDEAHIRVYRPRKSECLLCGRTFESYDPRYNRRCPSCQALVEHSTAFATDDEYHLDR